METTYLWPVLPTMDSGIYTYHLQLNGVIYDSYGKLSSRYGRYGMNIFTLALMNKKTGACLRQLSTIFLMKQDKTPSYKQ